MRAWSLRRRAPRPHRRPLPSLLGDLVDVNSAPEAELANLPGLDAVHARWIVVLRDELDGFTSLEQLAGMLRLPRAVVEDLREPTIFLPR